MMEPNVKNTYTIPASSQEAPIANSPELVRAATQEALQYAADAQRANPDNFDRRRVEGFGASMLTAAETVATPEAPVVDESWWENPAILGNFGAGTVRFRTAALHAQGVSRDGFTLGRNE